MSKITLGIIGGGQLGSMLCMAAKRLNVKTVVISDDVDAPAKNFADKFVFSSYSDNENIKEFLSQVDRITFE